MEKQTAGHDALGEFAPQFAHLNDDVLFGEVWAREEELSSKLRSVATVSALIGKGIVDSSLTYHLQTARAHGVTRTEMAALLTHLAFYAGWPNAWAAFRQAKEVYADDDASETADAAAGEAAAAGVAAGDSTAAGDVAAAEAQGHGGFFGLGSPNDAYAQYFVGQSYLNPLTDPAETVFMANVTFEPGCRNNWHIHHAAQGGGQILVCADGAGWYQEEGKPARALHPGDVVSIPAEVKHWHGAQADSWFSHVAVECPGEGCSNEWLEPVSDAEYAALG